MTEPLLVWSLSGALFLVGALTLVLRRHLIASVIGLELMLNAANLALVRAALARADERGLALALLVVAVAAAEAVVGISLVLALREGGDEAATDRIRELRG